MLSVLSVPDCQTVVYYTTQPYHHPPPLVSYFLSLPSFSAFHSRQGREMQPVGETEQRRMGREGERDESIEYRHKTIVEFVKHDVTPSHEHNLNCWHESLNPNSCQKHKAYPLIPFKLDLVLTCESIGSR